MKYLANKYVEIEKSKNVTAKQIEKQKTNCMFIQFMKTETFSVSVFVFVFCFLFFVCINIIASE